jgi:hypothetical protein
MAVRHHQVTYKAVSIKTTTSMLFDDRVDRDDTKNLAAETAYAEIATELHERVEELKAER